MPRGCPTDPEAVEQVMVAFGTCGSLKATARTAGLPESTVRGIIARDADRFREYRDERRLEIIDRACEVEQVLLDRIRELAARETCLRNAAIALGIVADKIQAVTIAMSSSGIEDRTGKYELTADDVAEAARTIREAEASLVSWNPSHLQTAKAPQVMATSL